MIQCLDLFFKFIVGFSATVHKKKKKKKKKKVPGLFFPTFFWANTENCSAKFCKKVKAHYEP